MKLKLLAFLSGALSLVTPSVNVQAEGRVSDLTVEVSGLHNYKGQVVLTLWPGWSEASKFPDATKMQLRDERANDVPCDFQKFAICRRRVDSLQNLTVSYTFRAVPPGDYAVFAFHDENSDGNLDTGLLKRPLEALGYSSVLPEDVNPLSRHIPFHRAKFTLPGPKTIAIGLRYPPRL